VVSKHRGLLNLNFEHEGYRHYRINQGESFATSRRWRIKGIENFRGYAKTKLKRYQQAWAFQGFSTSC
jgi:hypothetical protein